MRRSARRSGKVGDDGGDVEDPTKFRRRPGKELFSVSPLYSDLLPPATLFQSNNFCIIEGSETVQDFVQMQLQEIQDNIRSRRNKIFLLMEEVRRLRVQQQIKSVKSINVEETLLEATEMPEIPSSIPFLSNVTLKTPKQLYLTSVALISGIIFFGGLIAPGAQGRIRRNFVLRFDKELASSPAVKPS